MIIETLIKLNSVNKTIEQKCFGEVFTPDELINEMLDTLPTEVFTNPNLTWLDPAAGMGNFLAQVFKRLDSGLSDWEKNNEKRKKHILENMFYFVEIQSSSCILINEIFNKENKYTLNLFKGDFAQFDIFTFYKIEFDIIVGNPPYQDTIANQTRKAKNHNLWTYFIKRSFELLSYNGYLLFVTPPAWMSPSSSILKTIFLKYQIHYLNLEICSNYFKGIGSKFCYYLIQKCPPFKKAEFNFIYLGSSKLKKVKGQSFINFKSNYSFIPQLPSNEAFSILEKTVFATNEKLNIKYDSDLHRFTKKELLSTQKNEVFKYKTIHTPSQILWSSRPHKHQGKIKVFIPLTTYYEDILIDDCGNTQGMGYILCTTLNEAEQLKKLLLSQLFRFIANITRWSNFNVPEVMKLLPSTPLVNKELTDDFVFDFFKITNSEKKYILELFRSL
jgi:adenine-specific DNA-methyltransferase